MKTLKDKKKTNKEINYKISGMGYYRKYRYTDFFFYYYDVKEAVLRFKNIMKSFKNEVNINNYNGNFNEFKNEFVDAFIKKFDEIFGDFEK